ncbi:MAG TPA: hypothetical protein VMH35_10640 [Streptosporangiaceae bacterium]|nr:hypothetical protein [Streptosporangiaceae bacterium]
MDPKSPVDRQLALHASLGTVRQAVTDLGTISTRLADVDAGLVTAGKSGYSRLATQLDSLSSELAQAAGWLRDAAATDG